MPDIFSFVRGVLVFGVAVPVGGGLFGIYILTSAGPVIDLYLVFPFAGRLVSLFGEGVWVAQTVAVRVGAVEVLVEVVPAAGSQQTSVGGRVDRAVDYAAGAFERAQSAVEEIAVSTARMVGRVTRRVGSPESVEVEFGLKVSAKGDVIVAGASGEASLKVKIVYGGERAPRGAGEADPDDADAEAEEAQDAAL
jgi:hypothetical protein